MKIAIICSVPDPQKGGGQVWTWQFVDWLVKRGHQVHLICQAGKVDDPGSSVQMHCLRTRTRSEFATAAEQLVKQLDVDISHDMGGGWYADIHHSHVGSPVAFRKALGKLRPWYRRLGELPTAALLPRYRETRRIVARQYSTENHEVFVALSRKIIDDYVSLHGIPRQQIQLVANGVDVDRFSPGNGNERAQKRSSMNIKDDEIVLLQVAHNHVLKGIPALLQAAATLASKGNSCRVVVVGGRPSRKTRGLAKRLGISSIVDFVGPSDDVVSFYRMADVYVHATHYDACSLSVLEAMACGLPVITTIQNGATDMIDHGQSGFVFDKQDSAALDNHLEALVDPGVRQAMAKAARQRAEQYSLEHNFQSLYRLYTQLLARRQSTHAHVA